MTQDNSLTALTDEDLAQVVGGAGLPHDSSLPRRSGEEIPSIEFAEDHPVLGRDMTLPVRFEQALTGAIERLKQAAEAGDPQSALVQGASRVMHEDARLQELVNLYRNALHQD